MNFPPRDHSSNTCTSAVRAVFSEYHSDVAPGTTWQGIRCEDAQGLTWPDACFDPVTHTEVFEHVPDDARGFLELRRVLRPGGKMLFTVPLFDAPDTVDRVRGATALNT